MPEEPKRPLLVRLQNHILTMAPHQKGRMNGKLLIEAKNEIDRLEKALAQTQYDLNVSLKPQMWETERQRQCQ